MYKKYFKRPLDIILSFSALIILSPVLIIVYFLVKFKLGTPVIFKQDRPGLNEKIFTLYKFRTMTNEKDQEGNLLTDEKRLTKFGKWLRSTSLDELPELWNILKGDMSIVGPRPQLIIDMFFMTPEQRHRHTLLPGLTGLAQINGRNNISWSKKIKMDLVYINNISFILDFQIIIKTFIKVFMKADINEEGAESTYDYGDYLLKNRFISLDYYNKCLEKAIRFNER
jgi:lipopolysaccharide/colanic/teichoic acid biosynthesis glycosyltransferase